MDSPNVEVVLIKWLQGLLASDWPTFGDVPNELPESYILVDRTGGPREYMVLDRAELLVEVYHKSSRVAASNQANFIANQIPALLNVENITHAEVNSLIKLDDTINKYWRYQVYLDVYMRQ